MGDAFRKQTKAQVPPLDTQKLGDRSLSPMMSPGTPEAGIGLSAAIS